ncbi:MAG: PUR family DNA/RNA-binding protein [Ferruginibacter sp.]|nr:PUR family DNA/RNA-binding protein [Ferruginibacter sp.]
MAYEQNDNNERKQESVYSKRIKAGKRRTYFFDVRETRGSDFYLTITESRKRFDSDGYDRHKIFVYKEDFNKFIKGLGEAVDYVKTDLMPDFDFDAFNHDTPYEGDESTAAAPLTEVASTEAPSMHAEKTEEPAVEVEPVTEAKEEITPVDNGSKEEVDKW